MAKLVAEAVLFQPFLRFYRSCVWLFGVFMFFFGFLAVWRSPSSRALHTKQRRHATHNTPFFATHATKTQTTPKPNAILRRHARLCVFVSVFVFMLCFVFWFVLTFFVAVYLGVGFSAC